MEYIPEPSYVILSIYKNSLHRFSSQIHILVCLFNLPSVAVASKAFSNYAPDSLLPHGTMQFRSIDRKYRIGLLVRTVFIRWNAYNFKQMRPPGVWFAVIANNHWVGESDT